MRKAMIVEDEKILLDDLLELVDWKSMHVDVAYTERNGVNALRHFMREPVDIVITDIRMPVMSGVELAQKIREQDENVQIIFLTGYEEVEYMKSAIRVDAVSYILKPWQEEELKNAVKNAVDRIELIHNAGIGRQKRMETELVEIVLHGSRNLEIFGDRTYTLALVCISHFQVISDTQSAAEVNWILQEVRENLRSFYRHRSEEVVISYISKGQFLIAAEDRDGYISYGESEEAELNEGLESICQVRLISAGQNAVYRAESFPDAYQKLQEGLRESFYDGVRPLMGSTEKLDDRKQRLILGINELPETAALVQLKELFRQMATERTESTQIINDCFEICGSIYDHFIGKYKAKDVLSSEKREILEKLEECERLKEIEQYVCEFYIDTVRMNGKEEEMRDEEKAVQKIISYIDKHYAEPISAESLAEEVYFASNTIRIMLKKKTGSTVHEYLTKVRMEKATELLKQRDKKIKDIAKDVGYDNVSHFCMRFSKDYGMSPLAYRRKWLMKENGGEQENE